MALCHHTIFLMEDGTVKSVGSNQYGQLGLGNTTTPITTISTVPNLSGVRQVACGSHTVFLMDDGIVKSVGYNYYGQLGLGNTTDQSTPQNIPNLSNVKQVACGYYHTIFLMEDGTVKSVGLNSNGQLGLGNTTNQSTPQNIPNLSGVKQVACGVYHTVFLMEDGTVKSVGYNSNGQLGLGNTTDQSTPQNIPNLSGVKQVACGQYHTIFLMNDGTVKSVGYNDYGQLGLGNTTTPITTISTIPNLSGVKQVACGGNYTVFLMNDGTVKSVGSNQYGQLGLGNTTQQTTPQNIPDLSGIKQVACGYYHTVFLMEDGTVKSVGRNSDGQLGLGNTTDPIIVISIVFDLSDVDQVIEYAPIIYVKLEICNLSNIAPDTYNDVILSGLVTHRKGLNVSYRVLLNGWEVLPWSVLAPPPVDVSYAFNIFDFKDGENIVTVQAIDAGGEITEWSETVIISPKEAQITISKLEGTVPKNIDYEFPFIIKPPFYGLSEVTIPLQWEGGEVFGEGIIYSILIDKSMWKRINRIGK